VLVGLGWIATVVAANGLVSLGTGLEVVPVQDVGPLAEPAGVAVAALAVALRSGFATSRSVLLPIEAALMAAVAQIVVPALVVLLMAGSGPAFLAAGTSATSVFTLVDALLAALGGLIVLVVVRARAAGAGTPRWPWERDDAP
jgi:hypothetical protein